MAMPNRGPRPGGPGAGMMHEKVKVKDTRGTLKRLMQI